MSVVLRRIPRLTTPNIMSDFGTPQPPNAKGVVNYAINGSLLGIISASYNLGAIFAVPVVPWVANKYGRRWSIFLGSALQCAGAVIQCFSQHGKDIMPWAVWYKMLITW